MSMTSSSGSIKVSINHENNLSQMKSFANTENYLEASSNGLPEFSIALRESTNCIACIIESRGVATEVGITALNLENGICSLYQISDTSNYSQVLQILNLHMPQKVIAHILIV